MKRILPLFFLFAFTPLFAKFNAEISLDKADGFYKSGENAVCTVLIKKDGKALSGTKIRLLLKQEGKVIEKKVFVTTGKPLKISRSMKKPGWLYFGFEVLGEKDIPLKGKGIQKHRAKPTIVTEIGAIFDADKITKTIKAPADFDQFWQNQRKKLDASPLRPVLTPLPSGVENVKLYALTVPCPGIRPVTGYLAVPANIKPGSTPAVVEFLSWVNNDAYKKIAIAKAAKGILSLHATWHGFPVGKGKEYYEKNIPLEVKGGKKDIDNKEKWVMGAVYLRVMRALDYIKTRPEWDKKTLVVAGGSLGGAQSAAAAALDKDVTLALIGVPCFAEFDTRLSGRKASIPHRRAAPNNSGALAAGAYFDLVNLAQRITCEVFVCTGFTDELCPPSNVFAFYNALNPKCRKNMSTNPLTGHYGTTKNIKGIQRLTKLIDSVTVFDYTGK